MRRVKNQHGRRKRIQGPAGIFLLVLINAKLNSSVKLRVTVNLFLLNQCRRFIEVDIDQLVGDGCSRPVMLMTCLRLW